MKDTRYIDYNNPRIKGKAYALALDCKSKIDVISSFYTFVRDQISHSWDIKNKKITITASEVLVNGHGICYSKSNLLAALLRSQGIPTGFCYQRLTLGDTPDTGYCIHTLNAVYIAEQHRWIRLDARGNKPGINAWFSIKEEHLAFPVRPEYDEINYPEIYTDPQEVTMKALETSTDLLFLYEHGLPEKLQIIRYSR